MKKMNIYIFSGEQKNMSEKKLNSQTEITTGVFIDILDDTREYAIDFGELDAERAARMEFLLELEFEQQWDVGEWVASWYPSYRKRKGESDGHARGG
jgi:hypothetical protein